ncbi:unnamed protein product [Prunus armeniaca]
MATEDGALLRPAMEGSGIYHLIKLFDRLLVLNRSLLAAALCFWSLATNTMNLRFGMMTPTVLDMAALFGLSPLGVEVNSALVSPEAEGSFKAAWPTVAKLAGSKAKNMLNYSSFYSNFGVEDSANDDSIAPLGEVKHAAFLLYWLCKFVFCTQANKVTLEFTHLGPFLLGHIYSTLHDIVTDGMKPKHSELRGAVNIADTEPLANAFARAPRKHNTSTFFCKFFYGLVERTGSQFRECLARLYPLFLAHDLSVIPDGETENDLGLLPGRARPSLRPVQGWGQGLSAKLRGTAIQPDPDDTASPVVNQPALVLEGRRRPAEPMASISFQLQKGITFLTLTPWLRRNAYDEDGRVWYEEGREEGFEECRLRPHPSQGWQGEEGLGWTFSTEYANRGRTQGSGPSFGQSSDRDFKHGPNLQSAGCGVGAKNFAAQDRAIRPAGLTDRCPVGRKRDREALSIEAVAVEATPAESVVVETAVLERPRKMVLLVLSEGEDEEEVPPVIVSEAPLMTGQAVVEEVAAAEVAEMLDAEAVEMLDAEAAVAEVPAIEEAAVDMPDDEVLAVELTRAALVEVPSAASAVPTLAIIASVESLPSAPRRSSSIVIRSPPWSSLPLSTVVVSMPPSPLSQDSTVVTELSVVVAIATDVPSLPPVSSTVLTELVVAVILGVPSAAEVKTTSSDDLEELYVSLHEEGGISASAPFDKDSRAVVERLREFLFFGVHQMTTAEAFMEFRSCLDTAMALGLLDLAQLDELQARLAEGEEMIGRYAEANMRMTEACSLEQELSVIKEQVQPAMARLKENDLVVQRENEELAQVEVQIAELQARRDVILQRRDGAVAVGIELKSSARQILKATTEKKRALAERKLIRARWQEDIGGGDIAWGRITCLIWGMFSEGGLGRRPFKDLGM